MQLALLVFIDVKFFKFEIKPNFRSDVRLGMGDRAEYGSFKLGNTDKARLAFERVYTINVFLE
jgi:hypothetical protein